MVSSFAARFAVLAALILCAARISFAEVRLIPPADYRSSAADLELTFIDVGQGDAFLLRTPGGAAVLIDAGGDEPRADGSLSDSGKEKVLPLLRRKHVRRLDAVILSHSHPDHAGGLRAVLAQVPAVKFYDNGFGPPEDTAYREVLRTVSRKDIPRELLWAGRRVLLDDAVAIEVLAPPGKVPWASTNDHSLVLKITYGEASFLLPGDAEREEEKWLVAHVPEKLPAFALKAPHHGAYSSSSAPYIARVHPSVAIISCGLDNPYDHPHATILARYRTKGIQVFRTDYDGTVTITTNGREMKVEREKGN